MGYSVLYSPQTEKKFPPKRMKRKIRRIIVPAVLILCMLGIVISLNKGGLLYELLIPGQPAVATAAMETLAYNLREGMSFVTAVEKFCEEIISSAPLI